MLSVTCRQGIIAFMKGFLAVVVVYFLLACRRETVSPAESPEPRLSPALSAYYRVLTAVDSVNAALRDFHHAGGRLIYVYTITFPADTSMAPAIYISMKRP